MTTKRPIQAMSLPDVVPGAPPTPVPVVINVRPHELLVDPEYQRDLSAGTSPHPQDRRRVELAKVPRPHCCHDR